MLYPVKIYELMLKFTCIGFIFLVLTTTCSGIPSDNTTIILGLPSITPQTIKGIVSNTPTPTKIGSDTSYFTLTVELDSQEDIDLSIIPTSTISGYVENWQDLPVIPQPGLKVLEIYERGLALGNNPRLNNLTLSLVRILK